MPPEKPRFSSVFLVLSPFSSLFQKSNCHANKKMPNALFTPWGGFGLQNTLFEGRFSDLFHRICLFLLLKIPSNYFSKSGLYQNVVQTKSFQKP